ESEEDQMAEQHTPVWAIAYEQARPVEVRPTGPQQMRHIRAIVALALLNKALRPQHLLGGDELDGEAEHFAVHRMREPAVIDTGDAVAGAIDDVDVAAVAVGFGEPKRVGHLGCVAPRRERREDRAAVTWTCEDVEVAGMARDAGVPREGIRAADKEWHTGRL